mmetsp:Transcript_1557/g.4960  ORF Transcript_1557/g.4960 Transcript_1557/m.4960 type:complete len:209 (-) Transcript_1557:459-1085(-)
MERKRYPQGKSSISPVPTARLPSRRVRSKRAAATAPRAGPESPPGKMAAGWRWKTKRHSRSPVGSPPPSAASLARSSPWRRRGRSPLTASRASGLRASGSPRSMATRTPGIWVSSRSSLVVNAAWRGPRRPTRSTRRMALRERASTAAGLMSVLARSSTDLSSTRATSRATLPWPTTSAVSCCARSYAWPAEDGWPLYQATNSRAEIT